MKSRFHIFLFSFYLINLNVDNARADDNLPPHMPLGALTSQPIGHHNYCKEFPSDCSLTFISTEATKLTRNLWGDLVRINKQANAAVSPITDMEYYNQEELWAYPTSYGDCEDYALLKRHRLMQLGWPASSLLMTLVRQPNGEGHAVLTVRTDKADYILDNLVEKIKPWNKTDYRYLKRMSSSYSGVWKTIHDPRPEY